MHKLDLNNSGEEVVYGRNIYTNNSPIGYLLNSTQVPQVDERKECKAVELRRGRKLANAPKNVEVDSKENDKSQESQKQEEVVEALVHVPQVTPTKYVPRIPYHQWLQKSK